MSLAIWQFCVFLITTRALKQKRKHMNNLEPFELCSYSEINAALDKLLQVVYFFIEDRAVKERYTGWRKKPAFLTAQNLWCLKQQVVMH